MERSPQIKGAYVWAGIFGLFFFALLMAQMIHHEITGSILSVDVSDMAGFLGVWAILAYLLDVVCFGGLIIFFVRWRKRKRREFI